MENFFLLLRVLVSLAAVLGLLFYLRKRLLPRFGSPRTSQVTVVERHGIGPRSSVVLLDVHGRRYLLGVGEASINVLDSFEAPEPPTAVPAAGSADEAGNADAPRRSQAFELSLRKVAGASAAGPALPGTIDPAVPGDAAGRAPLDVHPAGTPAGTPAGPLAGSVLSPDTWRQAWAALKAGRSA